MYDRMALLDSKEEVRCKGCQRSRETGCSQQNSSNAMMVVNMTIALTIASVNLVGVLSTFE